MKKIHKTLKLSILTTIMFKFISLSIFAIQSNFVSFNQKYQKNILNETPKIVWKHPEVIAAQAGSEIQLDFSCSDPDFHRLNAFIRQNEEKSTGRLKLHLKTSLQKISISIPNSAQKNEVYAIDLEVKDEGNPPQSAFQHFTIKII